MNKSNASIRFLLISVMFLLYFCFIVLPYGNNHGFFNENKLPPLNQRLLFFLIATPIFIGYAMFIYKLFKKVLYLKTFSYPLLVVNIYFGVFACLLVLGGAILWMMVLTIWIPILLAPAGLIVGIIQDIKYLRNLRDEFYPK